MAVQSSSGGGTSSTAAKAAQDKRDAERKAAEERKAAAAKAKALQDKAEQDKRDAERKAAEQQKARAASEAKARTEAARKAVEAKAKAEQDKADAARKAAEQKKAAAAKAKTTTPATTKAKTTTTTPKATTPTTTKPKATTPTTTKPKTTTDKDTDTDTGRQAEDGKILEGIDTTVTTGVNDNASEVMDLLTQVLNGGIPEGGNYDYTAIKQLALSNPELMSAADLAKLYGLDYNLQNITDILMKGATDSYKTQYTDQNTNENNYYRNAAVTQNTLADTLRNQQSQAIMAGTNRGMQAANALSTVLGSSQAFAQEATQLATDRQKLSQAYAAERAKANENALSTYNAMGADLADLSKSNYSSDISKYVGQLDYNTGVNTTNGQMATQKMASESNWDTTLADALSSVYGNYLTNQSNQAQAATTANGNTTAAGIYAAATRDSAATNAAATRDAANAAAASNSAYNSTTASGFDSGSFVSNVATGTLDAGQAQQYLDGAKAVGQLDDATYNSLNTWLNKTTTSGKTTTPSKTEEKVKGYFPIL